jgi:hypothetical protein
MATIHKAKPLRSYTPTKRELAAIEKVRAEIREGNLYTLDELHTSLAGNHRPLRSKQISNQNLTNFGVSLIIQA